MNMTDLEDLFEGSLTLDTNELNMMTKRDHTSKPSAHWDPMQKAEQHGKQDGWLNAKSKSTNIHAKTYGRDKHENENST